MKINVLDPPRQEKIATSPDNHSISRFPGSHSAEGLAAEIKKTSWLRMMESREVGEVQARNAVIFAYEAGLVSATDAFRHLDEHGLLGTDEDMMYVYICGIRAISNMILPPDCPEIRVEQWHEPEIEMPVDFGPDLELIEVLAEARNNG